MSDLDLREIEIHGLPVHSSVKIHGPPGTGKTTQLLGRGIRVWDNEENDIAIENSAICTYRDSLAEDFRARVVEHDILDRDELESPNRGRTRWINTVHSLASKTVKSSELPDAGATDKYKRAFMWSEYGIEFDDSNRSRGKTMFQVLQWCWNADKNPANAHQAPAYGRLQDVWPQHPPVTDFVGKWESFKDEEELFDFHELLTAAIESDRTPAREELKLLIIDEYHDTYELMDALLRQWIDEAEIAIVAGDPDQVVNSYEGSSPRYFQALDLPEVTLPTSWRVPENHWELATDVLDQEHSPPDTQTNRDGGSITVVDSPRFEYSQNLEQWSHVPTHSKWSPSEIVHETEGETLFLTRTNKQAAGIGKALKESGVLFDGVSAAGGWDDAEMRLRLYTALQVMWHTRADTSDEPASVEWDIDSPPEKDPSDITVPAEAASCLIRHTRTVHTGISDDDVSYVVSFVTRNDRVSIDDLATVLGDAYNVYNRGPKSVSELTGVKKDTCDIIRRAIAANDRKLTESSQYDVRVLTIHAAKGSEAETVAVYDGVTSTIRDKIRFSRETKQNECRTWYVALTRSSENLIILKNGFEWMWDYLTRELLRGVDAPEVGLHDENEVSAS